MTYVDAIKTLLEAIKEETSADAISIICYEETKRYSLSQLDEIIEYVEAVDDVTGIRAFSGANSLGWFGIEPLNDDLLDVIYDYTDNDYCAKIMDKLN